MAPWETKCRNSTHWSSARMVQFIRGEENIHFRRSIVDRSRISECKLLGTTCEMVSSKFLTSSFSEKFKDSMFKIQTADMERIVLSNKYVDEIRTAPESLLSVREGMCEVSLAAYFNLSPCS